MIAARETPPPSSTRLSPVYATPAARADTVRRVWDTIAEVYYDPGFNGKDVAALRGQALAEGLAADSDAAFHRALRRSVRALDDSHTGVLTAREADNARARRATQIGLSFRVVDDRVLITRVVPGFPAARAGVVAGMVLAAVDGRSLDGDFLAHPRTDADPEPSLARTPEEAFRDDQRRAIRALLVERSGVTEAHRLTLVRADGSRLDTIVRAVTADVPLHVEYRRLPSGIGVLAFNQFEWAARDAIARALAIAQSDTRALVIDLRGNPGGEERLFAWFAGRFVPRDVEIVSTRSRGAPDEPLVAQAGPPTYDRPIAVLIDGGTASSAELTAAVLVEQRQAVLVGETSCGCVVAIRGEYVLPDGGALRVTRRGYRTAGGRRLEHDPLVPAVVVEPTLAQWRSGDDVVLDVAERLLTGSTGTLPASDRNGLAEPSAGISPGLPGRVAVQDGEDPAAR